MRTITVDCITLTIKPMRIELLTHLSLIRISGSDAEQFLQGQLTSDISQLNDTWQYAGYCSPKGRLLALLRIWRLEDGFYALISTDLVDAVSKRLRMYVMRSKVQIELLENTQMVGLSSRDLLTKTQLNEIGLTEEISSLAEYDNGDLIQLSHACALVINQRALLVGQDIIAIDQALTNDPENFWMTAQINDGLPQVNAQSTDLFIPQMLNLELLGGISFKKGCYTGQEIVARMHYLGKLKQRMFICDLVQNNGTQNGDSILAEVGQKIFADVGLEKSVGTIVTVDQPQKSALAVLRLANITQPLYLYGGVQLNVRSSQAYKLPEIEAE